MNGFEDIWVDGWQVRGTLSLWAIDLFDQDGAMGLRMRVKGEVTYFGVLRVTNWIQNKSRFADVWGDKSLKASKFLLSFQVNNSSLTIKRHWKTKINNISN